MTAKAVVKCAGSTGKLQLKLGSLGAGEVGGIPGVGVTSIDIRKNFNCEGNHLDCN